MRIIQLLGVGLVSTAVSCGAAGPGAVSSVENAEPKYGGVLNVWAEGDPVDWDMTYGGSTNAPGIRLVYESLLGFKTQPEVSYYDLVLAPKLAERWEMTPDGKNYTFYLRKGTKFANIPPVNGRELTAADVKWSYEYQARTGEFADVKIPKSNSAEQFQGMEAIETLDAHTVRLRFKEPFAPFLNYAATPMNPIMPREIYDADGHLRQRAVGTAAYQLDPAASQKGTRWTFKKNTEYWQTGKPYIDEIRWLVLAEESTAYAAFQSKQVDLISDVRDPIAAQQIADANPNAVYQKYQRTPLALHFNNQRPPVTDARVRKAFSMAIDRDVFSRMLGGGEWDVAGVSAAVGILSQEEIKNVLRYDPAGAKSLLRDAGYPDGLSVEYMVQDDAIPIFELVQAQVKQVGINLVPRMVSSTERAARLRSGDYFIAGSNTAPKVDIDGDLYGTYHSSSSVNHNKVKDAKLDSLVEAQRRESNPEKRLEVIREALRYINANTFASTLPRALAFHFWQPSLKNYGPHLSEANGVPGLRGPVSGSWLDK